jgi:hypothetical protein
MSHPLRKAFSNLAEAPPPPPDDPARDAQIDYTWHIVMVLVAAVILLGAIGFYLAVVLSP